MALTQKSADIVPVIVGTAGHVDHGKSALVKLLTGCEMDRHPEARARGLTIDLGFAPCRLPGNRLVGIVDVPGHEDFIRNMVAGAASMDVLMLIIAADDGVMPQTREHLLIVRSLRTARLLVVVTKIDLVDSDMRDLVREDAAAFLAANGYGDAPVLLASNVTFDGVNAVREALIQIVDEIERAPDPRAFRMYVERVFSVKGYGTVVTGIPLSGTAPVGETVELLPANSQHALRAVQSYKQKAAAAVAGACVAMNLRDLDADAVTRGMVVAAPGVYASTSGVIAHLRNEHAAFTLKRLAQVKIHTGTAVANASTKLIDKDRLKPGEEGFVQIRFEQPLVVAAGDRFILRVLSPVTTLGGGLILTASDYRFKRSNPHLLPRLQAALTAAQTGELLLSELLAGPEAVFTTAAVRRFTQCQGEAADTALQAVKDSGALVPLGTEGWLVPLRRAELVERMRSLLSRYHKANPYQWGMDATYACAQLGLAPGCFKALASQLTREKHVIVQHGRLALPDFSPALSAQQMKWQEGVRARVADGGINAPARGTLMKELKIPEKEMRLILRLLGEEGALTLVGVNVIDTRVLARCREKLLELFTAKDIVEVGDFRRVSGASRNLAVALLEQFDTDGITKRVDAGRVLVGTARSEET